MKTNERTNKETKGKGNKVGLFISMIVILLIIIGIFIISPRITNVIQNIALYLYELDANYITRVIELTLSISLVIVASFPINLLANKNR